METNIKHPRDTSWWDEREVIRADYWSGDKERKDELLAAGVPHDLEHDFIIATDGSGCTKGWGAYSAIIQPVEYNPATQCRYIDQEAVEVRVGATYGSTVQRSEFSGMLEGVHTALTMILGRGGVEDDLLRKEPGGWRNIFRGERRLRIKWYTDRRNLAECLTYDEHGDPLAPRKSSPDLWLRYSFYAPSICITPVHMPRNTDPRQAVADAMCTLARNAIKDTMPLLAGATQNYYPIKSWITSKPQRDNQF